MTLRACACIALTLSATPVAAQSSSRFGTCAYWQEQKPKDSGDTKGWYRIGFAHGFVFGVLGDIPSAPESDPRLIALTDRFDRGLAEAAQRPAFLADAFDQKCADYRNRGVLLSAIGLIVLLEVGGESAPLIDRAVEEMRAGSKERALDVLMGSR